MKQILIFLFLFPVILTAQYQEVKVIQIDATTFQIQARESSAFPQKWIHFEPADSASVAEFMLQKASSLIERSARLEAKAIEPEATVDPIAVAFFNFANIDIEEKLAEELRTNPLFIGTFTLKRPSKADIQLTSDGFTMKNGANQTILAIKPVASNKMYATDPNDNTYSLYSKDGVTWFTELKTNQRFLLIKN